MICQDLPGATGLFPQSWDLRVDLVQKERVLSSLSQLQRDSRFVSCSVTRVGPGFSFSLVKHELEGIYLPQLLPRNISAEEVTCTDFFLLSLSPTSISQAETQWIKSQWEC